MPIEVHLTLSGITPDPNGALTVGSFDGVHLGHREIIKKLRQEATVYGGKATVVTFEPHPQLVLRRQDRPTMQILTTASEKVELLQAAGVDRVVMIPFTKEFSQTTSDDFVRQTLLAKIGMRAIVIGHDHGFGKDREGDVETLRALGKELGFTALEVGPRNDGEQPISSTRIRQALSAGKVEQAAVWLGADYQLSGRVVHGDGRGQKIGFPTANLAVTDEYKVIPADGVYAVKVRVENQWFGGMMNIGTRPTFNDASRAVEVHLFEFLGNLYEQLLAVHFIGRLRSERKFGSIEELKRQLERDRVESLGILNMQSETNRNN